MKGNNGVKYALKRMYVNNETDLIVAKREIQITVRYLFFLIHKIFIVIHIIAIALFLSGSLLIFISY